MDITDSYFDQFMSFETAQLYITDRTDQVRNETYHNCLYFDLPPNHPFELNETDFVRFLSKIKTNRQRQWGNARVTSGMICYIWFDEMSGQLRVNFINNNHAKLPFGCDIEFVADEREIISLFLQSAVRRMIPWSDLKDAKADETTEVAPYVLKVYQQTFNITK